MSPIQELEVHIGYSFQNASLIEKAMTHTSFANEHGKGHLGSNQRLEFLGDSVLGLIVSTYLYARYPNMPEGKLSRLRASVVCETTLAEIAQKIGIPRCLKLGNGEEQTGGRRKPSLLADAMESLLAAIYLDANYETASDVLMNRIGFEKIINRASVDFEKIDYKTALQEHFKNPEDTVSYEITDVQGPPHDCTYYAKATVIRQETVLYTAKGIGRSKKDAEAMAAKALLARLSSCG